MSAFSWLTDRFSSRGKALTLYKRGMVRAKKRDYHGAIVDYTAIIGIAETPSDVRAMVLYNRAIAHAASGDDRKAVDDLDAVLTMDDAPVNVKTMARQKLARIASRPGKSNV